MGETGDEAYDRNVPVLCAGDSLFGRSSSDRNRRNVAHLRSGHADGFRMAADLLVEHVLVNGYDQDYLVWPIAFGYRQYLELRLKSLLVDASSLLELPKPSLKDLNRHELDWLWMMARPLVERIFPSWCEQLDFIGLRIAEIHRVDPRSVGFRYAENTAGTRALPNELQYVDLANLRYVMGKIASRLDGADTGIGQYNYGRVSSDEEE